MIYGQRMIYFTNDQDKLPITYKLKMLVRRAVDATLSFEGFENDCEVSVTFTDNEHIHLLNEQYRGVDRPTDVLSFPMTDFSGDSGEPAIDAPLISLGDIVISLEKAAEQAEEFGRGGRAGYARPSDGHHGGHGAGSQKGLRCKIQRSEKGDLSWAN